MKPNNLHLREFLIDDVPYLLNTSQFVFTRMSRFILRVSSRPTIHPPHKTTGLQGSGPLLVQVVWWPTPSQILQSTFNHQVKDTRVNI